MFKTIFRGESKVYLNKYEAEQSLAKEILVRFCSEEYNHNLFYLYNSGQYSEVISRWNSFIVSIYHIQQLADYERAKLEPLVGTALA